MTTDQWYKLTIILSTLVVVLILGVVLMVRLIPHHTGPAPSCHGSGVRWSHEDEGALYVVCNDGSSYR